MNSHDNISKKSRAVFENSVERLDIATANRLRLMRRDTLSQHRQSRLRILLVPISAALAIALGVALFIPQMQADKIMTSQEAMYISAEDEADIDLVDWLADAPIDVSSQMQDSL